MVLQGLSKDRHPVGIVWPKLEDPRDSASPGFCQG